MRPEVPIFRDEKRGQLRARFQELKEEGKRAPTFNLCSLGEFDYAPSGRPRSEPQKQILAAQLYMQVLERERNKAEEEPKVQEVRTVGDVLRKYIKEIMER